MSAFPAAPGLTAFVAFRDFRFGLHLGTPARGDASRSRTRETASEREAASDLVEAPGAGRFDTRPGAPARNAEKTIAVSRTIESEALNPVMAYSPSPRALGAAQLLRRPTLPGSLIDTRV